MLALSIRVFQIPYVRTLDQLFHVSRWAFHCTFFLRQSCDTNTLRIPNVPRIHVRVINSALLTLRTIPLVFLSYSSYVQDDVFQYSELHWFHLGSETLFLQHRCCFLLLFLSIPLLRWVSCIDRRMCTEFFFTLSISSSCFTAAAASEYYAYVRILGNATVSLRYIHILLLVCSNYILMFRVRQWSSSWFAICG